MRLLCAILLLCLLLGSSCGDNRKTAQRKPYDLGQSEALLQAGDALMTENAEWESLVQNQLLNRDLANFLRNRSHSRELFQEAGALLQQERFHDLGSLIDEAEKRGEASPALLELRELPQALQALSLYCARRPYQNSADLEQSLNFLSPWTDELARMAPQAFPPFLESQQELLAELRKQELQKRVTELLQAMDQALTTTGNDIDSPELVLASLMEIAPNAELPAYASLDRSPLPAFQKTVDSGIPWTPSMELAAAFCWDALDRQTRQKAERILAGMTPDTLTGQVLKARAMHSPEEYLDALAHWQGATPETLLPEVAPAFLPEYLTLLKDLRTPSPLSTPQDPLERFLQAVP